MAGSTQRYLCVALELLDLEHPSIHQNMKLCDIKTARRLARNEVLDCSGALLEPFAACVSLILGILLEESGSGSGERFLPSVDMRARRRAASERGEGFVDCTAHTKHNECLQMLYKPGRNV